jgi:hypothetical protein
VANTTVPPTGGRPETLVERHAWKVLLGLSAVIALFGLDDITKGGSTYATGETALFQGVTGLTWQELQSANPRVANLVDLNVRSGGSTLLSLGLLSALVCLTGLRRGERWAWYAMWIWPLWLALAVYLTWSAEKVPGAGTPVPVISGTILFLVAVLTLALSSRKYLSKQR